MCVSSFYDSKKERKIHVPLFTLSSNEFVDSRNYSLPLGISSGIHVTRIDEMCIRVYVSVMPMYVTRVLGPPRSLGGRRIYQLLMAQSCL